MEVVHTCPDVKYWSEKFYAVPSLPTHGLRRNLCDVLAKVFRDKVRLKQAYAVLCQLMLTVINDPSPVVQKLLVIVTLKLLF